MPSHLRFLATFAFLGAELFLLKCNAFVVSRPSLAQSRRSPTFLSESLSAPDNSALPATAPSQPALVLNGKRVLPYKVLMGGLKDQKVAAVYAVYDSSYKRGQEGWHVAVHVGVSQDLQATLQSHAEKHGPEKLAHVRALSFSFPQPGAMQDVASQWKELALQAGANLDSSWADDALNYLFDEDDDDDDDDDDLALEMAGAAMATETANGETIISPFESGAPSELAASSVSDQPLVFNAENVDKVLDEVRPYLIADGGNVVVERVDDASKNVYLKLEGACGSCSSSTVTMQMGVERVLRENFPDLNEVLQIEDDPESKPKELTWEAVEDEVSRLSSAIIAMGGVVELLDVLPSTGTVKMKYRGPNKVQQGLELAIRDIDFVNHVEFVMGQD